MPITGNNLEIATVIFTASTSITDTATVSYSTSSAGIFSNPDGEKLADSSGGTLDAQPGSVMVAEGATILGTMLLQGRTNHTGTVVSVLPEATCRQLRIQAVRSAVVG